MNVDRRVNTARNISSKYVGAASYEATFGLQFLDEDLCDSFDRIKGPSRLLVSDRRIGLPSSLQSKRIAIVGNGKVVECGSAIDEHDEIIRITGMRNWTRDPSQDGGRTTVWAGYPCFVVYRDGFNNLVVNEAFAELVNSGVDIWALSPFHLSVDSYRWLTEVNRIDDLLVVPTPAVIYDLACNRLNAEELSHLFHIPTNRGNIVGLPVYDLLLTGTRLALLLYLCGASHLSFYGCDMFESEQTTLWEGHNLRDDRKIMAMIKQRLINTGGHFYWHGHT